MKITIALFTNIGLVLGHTKVFFVKDQAKCVLPTSGGNNPIKDVQSPDMTCGQGASPASEECKIAAGGSLELQYGHNGPADDIVDSSHIGPCNVYLAPSTDGGRAPRDGWFKIYQGVWDPQNKWCTDKLIKDRGVLSIPIPSNVKAGSYILRSEINALHEANRPGGAQFYIFCLAVRVSGRGKALPSRAEIVSIPGYLNQNSPGVVYNPYSGDPHNSGGGYPTLGPAVSKLAVITGKDVDESEDDTTDTEESDEEGTEDNEEADEDDDTNSNAAQEKPKDVVPKKNPKPVGESVDVEPMPGAPEKTAKTTKPAHKHDDKVNQQDAAKPQGKLKHVVEPTYSSTEEVAPEMADNGQMNHQNIKPKKAHKKTHPSDTGRPYPPPNTDQPAEKHVSYGADGQPYQVSGPGYQQQQAPQPNYQQNQYQHQGHDGGMGGGWWHHNHQHHMEFIHNIFNFWKSFI